MAQSDSIKRHHLIIQKIRKRPLNFNDLAHYLELESELQGYNFRVSKRTFQRDIRDIEKIYKINIEFDYSEMVYKIVQEDQAELNERIFEAYETFNTLNLSEKLSEHIHFEGRKPRGTDNLHGLLHAIKKEVQISFIYYNFLTEKNSIVQVEPYALKEFRSRWYLVGYNLNNKEEPIGIFGLDRLSHLEITSKAFIHPKNFNVKEYFKHCFGIFRPNADQPEEIILSFTAHQGQYVKSLPLHDSQKEIKTDKEDEYRIKLTLFITYDFIIELRTFGENMKVIEPQSLAETLKTSSSSLIISISMA